MFFKTLALCANNFYSKSFLPGLREGSEDKNPKIKIPTKKATVIYTTIFRVSISISPYNKFDLLAARAEDDLAFRDI